MWKINKNGMELRREILKLLLKWKEQKDRKPLIIQGARQIGKTWAMMKFGETSFENTAYFNFDTSRELAMEFEKTKDPSRLIGTLQLYTQQPIVAGKTLIIFDEIQECNKALNSLKYFCENAPQYHVIAAGSLLGVSLASGDSFPVGKVDFLRMNPLTFKEFLLADNPRMFDYMESLSAIEPLPEIVMGQMTESFRKYQVCGGMPSAAKAMLEGKGVEAVGNELSAILTAYTLDFSKHAPASEIPRISAIWNSVTSQLSRENRKFVYKIVKDGARSRDYENALLWLEHAGLIYRIWCSSKPGLPIKAYDDLSAFKIYLCDVGLLRQLAQLPPEIFWKENPMFKEFKGALTENTILQSLTANFEVTPRYWTSNGNAEIDFLLQKGLELIPIEVKSGTSVHGKSLSVYMKQFAPQRAIVYSMNNLSDDGTILRIPLFAADWTKHFLA